MAKKWWQVFSSDSSIQESQLPPEVLDNIRKLTEELDGYRSNGTTDPVLIAHAKVLAESLKNNRSISDYQVAAAYGAVYTKVAESRRKLIKEVEKMSYFYLLDVIVSQFVEDALAPEIGTGNIIEISSTNKILQKEVDSLEEKIDFDQLILSIAPDMIKFGEYTLSTKVNPKAAPPTDKKENVSEDIINVVDIDPQASKEIKIDDTYGLKSVRDDVEQGTVIALTEYDDIKGYLIIDERGRVHRKESADYVKFSLSSQRLRIDIFKEFGIKKETIEKDEVLKDIPRYIRVGKSLIYPILSKIKELELLETLVPATKLSKLSNGSIVGMQVPTGYDITKALEASRQVEGVINKKVGVDPKLGELTIENIMSTAGRVKVVPIFGEKGQLNKMDYQSDEPDELLSSVKDIREIILSSVGIPYELIYSSDGQSKGELLKKYARYLRKLKSIQKAIENGVREIVYIHLTNKGYDFSPEDIKVEFFNKLIEIDNLDKLEFMDTTIGLLGNLKSFILDLSNPTLNPQFANRIDLTGFIDFLNKQLNVIGFNNLIKEVESQNPNAPKINVGTKSTVRNFISRDNDTSSPRDAGSNVVHKDDYGQNA